jgi:hypothetical protein
MTKAPLPENPFGQMGPATLLVMLIGGPVIALLTFGGMMWAKYVSAPTPNPTLGQVYEVCIGRSCTPRYVDWRHFVIYQLTQVPIELILVAGTAVTLWGLFIAGRRRYNRK